MTINFNRAIKICFGIMFFMADVKFNYNRK